MKICVYTAVFGGKDLVIPPKEQGKGIDFIAFTDKLTNFPRPWQLRTFSFPRVFSPRLKGRYLKIRGPEILKEYDVSIWIDGNVRLATDLQNLVDEFIMSGQPIAVIKHPHRSSIVEEAEACERLEKVSAAEVPALQNQVRRYLSEGFPGDGLIESNVVFRRNHARGMLEAMTLWWSEVRDHCIRDQISLPYVLWKTGLDVHYWNWSTRSQNSPFPIHGHRTGPFEDLVGYFSARRNDALIFKVGAVPLLLTRRAINKIRRSF